MNRRNFLFTVLGIGAIAKAVKSDDKWTFFPFDKNRDGVAELCGITNEDIQKMQDSLEDFEFNWHKRFFRADGVNTYIPSNLNEFNFKNNRHKWKSR